MQDAVVPFDLARMFLGDQEALFYLEIVVRTIIVYVYAMILVRWLGSRTIGQLSIIEFLLVIALGSAVGDPMFQPDVPILHALTVITVVILANKGLDWIIDRSQKAERLVDGSPYEIICKGVISQTCNGRNLLGRSELFQALRMEGISHLGQVERAYIEPSGTVSIFRAEKPGPGLPIVPPWGVSPPQIIPADSVSGKNMDLACLQCGHVLASTATKSPNCPNCEHHEWTEAKI